MEYLPINPVENAKKITIEMPAFQTSTIMNIQDALLAVKLKIVKKSDGQALPLGTVVGPVNNPGCSCFSGLKIWINGKEVYSLGDLFHYRAYMEVSCY